MILERKKLLRNAENKVCCNSTVIRIYCSSSSDFRLGCGYSQHPRLPHSRWRHAGVGFFTLYKTPENCLLIFADNSQPYR
jgi:hypothetical protein